MKKRMNYIYYRKLYAQIEYKNRIEIKLIKLLEIVNIIIF